ncbi:54S ribosomal protein L4 mitochondrial [Dinochytrium kinnereticum]|nr:54S ribosomal protein L4 mitochondrial [Dinochytrium kinnereticum]
MFITANTRPTIIPSSFITRTYSSATEATVSPDSDANSSTPIPEIPATTAVKGSGRGLLDFFDTEKGWSWRDNEKPTGRAWTAAELRGKSFEDLHRLWWVCIKEVNLLESQRIEARRFRRIFPHDDRVKQVKLTMRRTKLVLWERRIMYLQSQAIVKLEVARRELYEKEIEAIRKARKVSGSASISKEAPVSKEGSTAEVAADASSPEWVEITADMRKRVDAKLKKMFPEPIHEIGRRESKNATEVEGADGRKAKGLRFVSGKGRRAKFGGRWFIL